MATPMLPLLSLPLIVLVTWGLFVFACASITAKADDRRGTPKEQRRLITFFPSCPSYLLLLWGMAWLADQWVAPWGTIVVVAMHLLWGVPLLPGMWRDAKTLWRRPRA